MRDGGGTSDHDRWSNDHPLVVPNLSVVHRFDRGQGTGQPVPTPIPHSPEAVTRGGSKHSSVRLAAVPEGEDGVLRDQLEAVGGERDLVHVADEDVFGFVEAAGGDPDVAAGGEVGDQAFVGGDGGVGG